MQQKELHDTVNDKIINSKAEFRWLFHICFVLNKRLNFKHPTTSKDWYTKHSFVAWHAVKST